jgi:hypothetical protein
LLLGDHLAFGVRAVLADQDECRHEDRFERDDHRQQTEWVLLDAEPDPAAEPEDMDIDEQHRPCEGGDPVGEPVLGVLGALLCMPQQHRVDWLRPPWGQHPPLQASGRASPPIGRVTCCWRGQRQIIARRDIRVHSCRRGFALASGYPRSRGRVSGTCDPTPR